MAMKPALPWIELHNTLGRITVAAIAAAGLCGSAQGQVPVVGPYPPSELDAPGVVKEPDPVLFCYYAGKAYSEGMVLHGRVCERRPTMDVLARYKQPLTWQPQAPEARKSINPRGGARKETSDE